jgi:uncharacterized protein involved in exopolysaccharide biosynthesis
MSDKTKYLVEETGSGIDIFLLLNVIKKNFILFLIVFTMLFSAFLLYIFTKKQEFYSSFPISINHNVSNFVINDLKNSTKLSKNELKTLLELTQDEVEDLNFIQITNITKTEDIHAATINVSTKNPNSIKPIADKLMTWVNSNPEIITILNKKSTSIQELLAKTNEQLFQINTIKEKYINAPVNSEITISFIEEYRILAYKNKLDQDIDALKTVTVLTSHYFMPSEPKNNSKKIPLFLAFISSILLTIIITLLMKYKKA